MRLSRSILHTQVIDRIMLVLVLASLTNCASLRARSTTGPGCPAAEPDDSREPLYAAGRELLADSAASALRDKFQLRGEFADVVWLTDDALCNQIRLTFKRDATAPAIAAVRVGNLILIEIRPGRNLWLDRKSVV